MSREKLTMTSKRYLHCISIDRVLSPTCALPSVPLSPIISSTGVFTDITKSHQIFLSKEVLRSSPQGSMRSKQICRAIASTVFEKKPVFMSRILSKHFNFREFFFAVEAKSTGLGACTAICALFTGLALPQMNFELPETAADHLHTFKKYVS